MSFTREVTLWCDAPEGDGRCIQWTQANPPAIRSVTDSRRDAQQRGWRYRNGKDLCPYHAGTES